MHAKPACQIELTIATNKLKPSSRVCKEVRSKAINTDKRESANAAAVGLKLPSRLVGAFNGGLRATFPLVTGGPSGTVPWGDIAQL